MEPKPETALVAECVKILRARGCLAWRQNVGARKCGDRFVRFGFPGLSDIIGLTPKGRFIAIECKVGNNPVSEEQREFLTSVTGRNGLAMVVRDDPSELVSVDL